MKWVFFFCFFPFIVWSQPPTKLDIFTPFFSYSTDDLKAIHSLPSSKESLSAQKFEEWDTQLYTITSKLKPDGRTTRLMAYLYVAQRDFALLSYQISQQWLGNPNSLIVKIIQLFEEDFQTPNSTKSDCYSEKIEEIIFHKIKERLKDEEAQLKDYPFKEGPAVWKETPPYIGQRIGTCQPWLLTTLSDVKVIPPPDPESIIWEYGLNQIQFDQACLTPQQRQLIFYWAGEQGPQSGNWLAIANHALQKKMLSLQEFLFIRAILAMSLTDALIVAFDSKYTYYVARPHMRSFPIMQILPVPKHPSYPSAHSVTSATAAFILSYFFPTEKQKWQKLAIEAANTRIWAGLHYMYDNEQGLIQGERVGKAIVERLGAFSKNR